MSAKVGQLCYSFPLRILASAGAYYLGKKFVYYISSDQPSDSSSKKNDPRKKWAKVVGIILGGGAFIYASYYQNKVYQLQGRVNLLCKYFGVLARASKKMQNPIVLLMPQDGNCLKTS